MILYHVRKAYCSDGIYYQVLPYNLKGTFKHMKLKNFISFLYTSRLNEDAAIRLAKKLSDKNKNKFDGDKNAI